MFLKLLVVMLFEEVDLLRRVDTLVEKLVLADKVLRDVEFADPGNAPVIKALFSRKIVLEYDLRKAYDRAAIYYLS